MKTILIVDDDPVSVQIIDMIVRRNGYEAASAASAAEALAWLDRCTGVEAIIADYNLGGTTGLELYLMLGIHLRYHSLPVILCTSAADPGTVSQALELGVRYFIVKPVNPQALMDKVEAAIRERPMNWARGVNHCPACGAPMARRP